MLRTLKRGKKQRKAKREGEETLEEGRRRNSPSMEGNRKGKRVKKE